MHFKISKSQWEFMGQQAGWLKSMASIESPSLQKAMDAFRQYLVRKGLNGIRIELRCNLEIERMMGMTDEEKINHLQEIMGLKKQVPA
jgi:hypothetical protein